MPWIKLGGAIAVIWWLRPRAPVSLIGIVVEKPSTGERAAGGDKLDWGYLI
jgi:hypothetical protein